MFVVKCLAARRQTVSCGCPCCNTPCCATPLAQVAWQRLRQCLDDDVAVEGEVVGTNRGGIIVEVRHLCLCCAGHQRCWAGHQLVGRATSLSPNRLDVTAARYANMCLQARFLCSRALPCCACACQNAASRLAAHPTVHRVAL